MHLAYMGTVYDKDYTEGLLEILLSSPLVSDEDGEYFRRAFASFLAGSALSGEDIYYRCLKILGEEAKAIFPSTVLTRDRMSFDIPLKD